MDTIYLDHNATTPLDPGVREVMLPLLGEVFGNPSSIHAVGRQARAVLDEAHEKMAALWHCKPGEVVFTAGGTEANNLAVLGAARARRDRGRHLITSAVEHPAVLEPLRYLARHEGFELTILGTDPSGRLATEDVRSAIRHDTVLVTLMAANNEIGTLQPVQEIGRLCRDRGILFHTDAVQWFGKEPVKAIGDFAADLVSGCAHKLFGPKGAGVLYVRSPLHLCPTLMGGSQESERRAGTENLAGIAGLVAAWERFASSPVFARKHLEPLCSLLEIRCAAVGGIRRWGAGSAGRLCNTLAVTAEGCDSLSLLAGLDLAGVCASSGSACSAGSLKPSSVLRSLGASTAEAMSLVRFSLGRDATRDEIATAGEVFGDVVSRVRNSGVGRLSP